MSGSLIQELKRRNVFRVAAIYIVVSWLLIQIGDVIFPALRLPDWTTTMLVAFLLLGLPVAIIFAWAFELTPDGVVRTTDVPEEQSITQVTGQKINYMIIGVLAVAVIFLLVKDIFLADDAPPAQTVATAPVDHSIAVLPFKNQSASTENAEFFAGGLHDELLTLLSRLADLKVISRTSVERLDPELSIPEIGTLLGVATVLEGQVQRAGDRLRINVQLINTRDEGHLWANIYDSELTAENIFDVQSDIALKISSALQAELSPVEEQLLEAVPTTSTAALEKYLLGVQIGRRATFDSLDDAAGYLAAATQLDPSYVDAWTALAATYSRMFQTGAITLSEYVRVMEPTVRTTLSLDPRNGAAYAQQALLQKAVGDKEGAEVSFRQALALDPNNSDAVAEYAFFLRDSLRAEEAIPLVEKALENDPLSTELLFQLGRAAMHAGRPERYMEIGARIREIDPAVVYGYTAPMQAHFWMGQYDLALKWFIKALEMDTQDYENWAHAGLGMQELGFSDLADRYLQRAGELGPGKPSVLKCQALVATLRGDTATAVAISRKALADNIDDRWGSDRTFLRIARDAALDGGNVSDVLEIYRERAPRVFEPDPVIAYRSIGYALDAALVLQHTGQTEQARRITAAGLATFDQLNPKRIRGFDFGIEDVEFLALSGDVDAALDRLQEAVDGGWTLGWQESVLGKNLEPLRDQPRFKAIVAALEARTVEQAASFAAIPHLGEFDLRDQ